MALEQQKERNEFDMKKWLKELKLHTLIPVFEREEIELEELLQLSSKKEKLEYGHVSPLHSIVFWTRNFHLYAGNSQKKT